jgi:hypothetical protein
MSKARRHRATLAIIGLGALLLVASVAVPVIAKKKGGPKVKVVTGANVVFTDGQATGNGDFFHKDTTVTCPKGYKPVGYGGSWTPKRDGALVGGLEVLETAGFAGRSVNFRLASDVDNLTAGPSTFTPQVVCSK